MLPWVERVYGIPPEQVVGSSGITNFQVGSDGRPVLMKEPNIEIVNDGQQTGWPSIGLSAGGQYWPLVIPTAIYRCCNGRRRELVLVL